MIPKLHAAVLSSLCALGASAAEAPLPLITTAALSAKIEAQPPQARDFTLVDARTRVEFAEAHIPGAVNCPAAEVAALLPKLVEERSRNLVFYCNGPKCTKSQKAAREALALGYTRVVEYNEGLPAWGQAGLPLAGKPLPSFEAQAISPEQLAQMRKGPRAPLVVDVRDRVEYQAFHLPGSLSIPLDDLRSHLRELPPGREIVLVCHSGHQSPIAARVLHALGRRDLKRLDGGLVAWQQKGLPTESGRMARH
ncbi:MAG TPA: rhodanese-like domain-containing protein [Myxococcales bacterium]|nr:rhodanese-like domain-containing protein [Myxococcales bacterium]